MPRGGRALLLPRAVPADARCRAQISAALEAVDSLVVPIVLKRDDFT